MQRINIVGATGAGKSTFARRLAQQLGHPCIALDELFWGANWTPRLRDVFIADVDRALSQPAWVCDGNYSYLKHLIWPRMDTVIWLDYRSLWGSPEFLQVARVWLHSPQEAEAWLNEPVAHNLLLPQ